VVIFSGNDENRYMNITYSITALMKQKKIEKVVSKGILGRSRGLRILFFINKGKLGRIDKEIGKRSRSQL